MLNPGPDMQTAGRVAKNTLAQVVRFAAIVISKFLIVIAIARWSGVEQVGQFSFVMNYALVFSFINHFGLLLLLVREIAQQRQRLHDYLGNALSLALGFGLLNLLLMGLIARWLGYGDQIVAAIYLVALATMLETLQGLFNAAFSGYERMELGALAMVVQEIAFLLIGLVILYLRLPFLWLFAIFILSRLVGLLASARIYGRIWGRPPYPRFHWPTVKELLYKTRPFVLHAALSPVFVRIDVLLLSYFQDYVAVGYYEVASTLFYRLNVLARMFNLALMPLVARQYALIGPAVSRYVKSAVKYQTVIALPITLLGWLLGDKIILLLYGPEFMPAISAFQIMASATLLRFLGNTLGLTLTAIDLQGRRSLIMALMAAFNITLNLFLLPRYTFMGAAVASVLTEIGTFLLLWAVLLTRLPNPFALKPLLRPALAALLMALPLLWLREGSLLLLLPLALLIYGLAALALGVLSPAELETLLKLGRLWPLIPPALQRRLLQRRPPATIPEQEIS